MTTLQMYSIFFYPTFFFTGWLYDITGTYDLSFYLAGFFIALSGLLLVVLPTLKRYRKFQNLHAANENKTRFYSVITSCLMGKVDKHEKSGCENHV